MRMQCYCDVYKWTILKRTSPEVKCLHPTSSRREMCTSSVSNVIYHKFSHGAAFYTPNGKNVNMLEYLINTGAQRQNVGGNTTIKNTSYLPLKLSRPPSVVVLYSLERKNEWHVDERSTDTRKTHRIIPITSLKKKKKKKKKN